MFIKDGLGNLERTSIYLSRPSGELLGCLDEYINEESASMLRGLNQQQQLSFDLNKQDDCWYEYVQEGMYLFVEGVGLFKMQQPKINIDGTHEVKNITANSCDSELEEKNINLEINMGTKTSQEFLVSYHEIDKGEQLVNPYTGVPYDWLVLYNTFPEQLTAHLATYNSGYFGSPNTDIVVTEKTKIDILNDLFTLIPRLKSKFDKVVDAETDEINYKLIEFADVTYNEYNGQIASITLYADYAKRVRYLIDFYTRNREALSLLSVVLEKTDGLWSVGDIYGVSDGDYSLANKKYQFETSENIYSFLTTSLAQATNCMAVFDIVNRKVNIVPVENIGKDTGIVISYDNLLNSLNIEATEDNLSTRLIVTGADDLNIEQVNFGLDYIDDLSYKMNAVDENNRRIYVTDALAAKYKNYVNSRENLRTEYIQGSKDYRKYTEQIDEIKNRVPLDDLKTDWGTFSEEELQASLTAYKNLLASLISLYRSEYYPQGLNEDDSVNEDFMATTVYWNDYKAYQNVIVEIECAISTFPYYSDHDKWSDYNKLRYEDAIKAWETEWYLYGSEELQAKIASYKNNMDTLAESAVIRTAADEDTIKTWNQLTDAEKTDFGNISDNYKYDLYMSYYNNMVSAQTYLATLLEQISDLEDARTVVQERRVEIVQLVALENNFTVDECKVLSSLFREADCSNDNILVTNIDSAEQKIDKMSELLEYGQEQLSIMSRPQLTFTISSDNLLGLTGFEDFWKDFEVGNYLLVQYRDDTYIKLRMVGYQYNPCLPSNNQLTITFSNIIRSKVGVTDLESLLGLSSSSSGRSGSGSSGGSGGNYGESDDIDITISNTMLAKLLNSELFGTRVQDVILNTIDVNAITARYATFDGLASGVTIIDGQCITTGWIVSLDYNGTTPGSVNNTAGSILNLNTGYFNFGGGRIKFDGSSLVVEGNIIATTLATGGRTSASTGHDGMYVDAQGNIYSGSTNGVIIYKDGKFNLANGKIVYNGTTTTIASDVIIGSNTVAQAWTDIQTAQTTADGKSKIYYGQPTVVIPPTYDELNEGDYLVDDTTGSTYRWSDGDQAWVLATDYASAIEAAVEEIEEELIPQIDGKIETWAQQTNPKTWSADVDAKHDGDLWYYTGVSTLTVDGVSILPSKTYKYSHSTGKWSLYQTPNKSLFDLADSKKKIFYGTTSGTYTDVEENDYLVDSTTGCTYRYHNSAWVKVTDYASADSVLEQSLKAQIDAKIETWAQDTNPATAWNTADLKAEHDGDLWYYIGLSNLTIDNVTIKPSKAYEYQYNSSTQTGVWSEYHSPSRSLFDLVDGKSTIFYGTPSGTYSNVETGDYLVDDTDGCSYRWSGTAWVKLTDYKDYTDTALQNLREDLEEQIDAQIETWAQNTDPASSWSASDKPAHDGDLWYYTGLSDLTVGTVTIKPSKTYQYDYDTDTSTGTWVVYNSPSRTLFDLADGKSTIFYGSTSGTYANVETNDYLVDSTTGCTYQYNGTTWVKVTDYKADISAAISALEEELERQIDAKIETWTQTNDPSTAWTTAELKAEHDGDLWYYIGTADSSVNDSQNNPVKPSKTYQYNSTTNKWVLYNSPNKSLFDVADGKSTIYYGTTSGSYPDVEENDYLVDATDGSTYRWTGLAWTKVTDYASSVAALEQSLEEQIDAKIETWAKSSDPAASWTTDEYEEHSNDLWLYTGLTDLLLGSITIHPQGIYKFVPLTSTAILDESGAQITDESGNNLVTEHTYQWAEYSSVSSNVFDMADGKSTIYYGTTSGSYPNVEVGDYLVDPTDGSTYKWDGVLWANVTNYSESLDAAIHALQDTLEKQIDGRVETWAQLSDPSTNWTEDEQPQHDGDLWFYTGTTDSTVKDSSNNYIKPSKTYQYNSTTNKWALYDSPSRSLFDFADGKATVFYGSTSQTFTPTPEEGDYLVDNTDSDTAGCTYRRTANNTWEKVTDYKAYTNSAIGVAKEDLENQIDAKVETWAQSTNPALSWSSSDIVAHNGDLWLYTGSTDLVIDGVTIHPQGIYKFACSANAEATLDESGNALLDESGNAIQNELCYKWNAYSSTSTNIFDLTDGKSTIFYGSTSNTYPGVAEGDYLVNNQNGTTYRYTGGQWVAVTKTGSLYGTCSSVATAKEKVVTCNESISVYEGLTISVKFANANTYYSDTMPLMLNIGKLGTKNVYYNGDLISSTNRMYWAAGATIMFMYDGNGWIVIGHPESYNGSCSTGASTAAKNCLIADAVVVKGTVVNITFTNTNSASSPTLNVIDNTTNAPTIAVDSSNNTLSSTSQYNWNDGACVGFTFDGQRWRLNDSSSLYNTNSYMRFESTGTAQGLMIANMRGGVVSNSAITAPNTLLTSTELLIRNGQIVLARFGTTIILGVETASHTVIQTDGMHIYASDGTTQIAHLGYGSGNDQQSGTSPAPYYTLGIRAGSSSADIGNYSVSEGYETKTSGWCSHAEGTWSEARGYDSHAEGLLAIASGDRSHAEGRETLASDDYSHAEGYGCVASGGISHAGGQFTIAQRVAQTAIGRWNVADTGGYITANYGLYAFIIGNGTDDNARSNALTVDWDGKLWIAGTLTQNSDKRLKTHLNYLSDDAVTFIRNLQPAHFLKDNEHHLGFYAQDVEKIDTWGCMVGEEARGYKTLGYLEILAPLVTYCHFLEKRINDLERKL